MRASLQTAKTSATASRLGVRPPKFWILPPSGLKLCPSTSKLRREPWALSLLGTAAPAVHGLTGNKEERPALLQDPGRVCKTSWHDSSCKVRRAPMVKPGTLDQRDTIELRCRGQPLQCTCHDQLHRRHLVGGERASLVGANHVGAAQRLHARQLSHDRVAICHLPAVMRAEYVLQWLLHDHCIVTHCRQQHNLASIAIICLSLKCRCIRIC